MTTKLTRRNFLKGLGAATVVVAGGVVYRAVDQGVFSVAQGDAYTAWETWDDFDDEGPMALVHAAILAASPHNTQPWLFEVSASQIDLYADGNRHLGAMDPFRREMCIGLGCALENMMLSAQALGYDVDLELANGRLTDWPTAGYPILVASLLLSEGVKRPSARHANIPYRHTDRFPYEDQAIAPETLAFMQTHTTDPDIKLMLFSQPDAAYQQFADLTVQATNQIIADADMAHDSFHWIRQSWNDVQTYKDGPYVDTSGASPLLRTAAKITPPLSQSQIDASWLASTKSTLATTPTVGFIALSDLYDVGQNLRAGQLWQWLSLWAINEGLALQPVNQIPEVVDRQMQLGQETHMAESVAQITGDNTWQPTFAFRMGYPTTKPLSSARRLVSDVLM